MSDVYSNFDAFIEKTKLFYTTEDNKQGNEVPSELKKNIFLSLGMSVQPKTNCKYGDITADDSKTLQQYLTSKNNQTNILNSLIRVLLEETSELETKHHSIRVFSEDGIYSISSSQQLKKLYKNTAFGGLNPQHTKNLQTVASLLCKMYPNKKQILFFPGRVWANSSKPDDVKIIHTLDDLKGDEKSEDESSNIIDFLDNVELESSIQDIQFYSNTGRVAVEPTIKYKNQTYTIDVGEGKYNQCFWISVITSLIEILHSFKEFRTDDLLKALKRCISFETRVIDPIVFKEFVKESYTGEIENVHSDTEMFDIEKHGRYRISLQNLLGEIPLLIFAQKEGGPSQGYNLESGKIYKKLYENEIKKDRETLPILLIQNYYPYHFEAAKNATLSDLIVDSKDGTIVGFRLTETSRNRMRIYDDDGNIVEIDISKLSEYVNKIKTDSVEDIKKASKELILTESHRNQIDDFTTKADIIKHIKDILEKDQRDKKSPSEPVDLNIPQLITEEGQKELYHLLRMIRDETESDIQIIQYINENIQKLIEQGVNNYSELYMPALLLAVERNSPEVMKAILTQLKPYGSIMMHGKTPLQRLIHGASKPKEINQYKDILNQLISYENTLDVDKHTVLDNIDRALKWSKKSVETQNGEDFKKFYGYHPLNDDGKQRIQILKELETILKKKLILFKTFKFAIFSYKNESVSIMLDKESTLQNLVDRMNESQVCPDGKHIGIGSSFKYSNEKFITIQQDIMNTPLKVVFTSEIDIKKEVNEIIILNIVCSDVGDASSLPPGDTGDTSSGDAGALPSLPPSDAGDASSGDAGDGSSGGASALPPLPPSDTGDASSGDAGDGSSGGASVPPPSLPITFHFKNKGGTEKTIQLEKSSNIGKLLEELNKAGVCQTKLKEAGDGQDQVKFTYSTKKAGTKFESLTFNSKATGRKSISKLGTVFKNKHNVYIQKFFCEESVGGRRKSKRKRKSSKRHRRRFIRA